MMRENIPILLVEDDQVDAMTVKRALADINVTNRLDITENGEAALEFLRNPANQQLDLNMPRMSGLEFLRIIKQDDTLKRIPVVVLTTSGEERDRVEAYGLGIAGYIVKPVDYMKFVEAVKTIDLYWTLCELPPGD